MKERLVIFDMDGVMVDTETMSFHAWRHTMEGAGILLTRTEYDQTIGRNNKDITKIYKGIFGQHVPVEELFVKKIALAQEMMEDQLEVKEGLYELFDYLEKKGYRKVVATSSAEERAQFILKKIGMDLRVDGVITGDDIKKGKPDPEIFLKAAELLHIPRENAIILEDSKSGLIGAVNAGIRCIFIPDLIPADDEVRKHAYAVVTSLKKVARLLEVAEWDI
ncbi:MAG TPA: HAD family phosphatase [Clostridiaceae bacterium]|nr:HAD family phosphatase [Clostridiaceae bacterium]